VTKRTILATALITLSAGGAATAGFFHGPYNLSQGPYYAAPSYSYNVAYGYGLPFGGYQLYNPFDPYQNPNHALGYYPRESFYSLPPYGLEPYYGAYLLPYFRDRARGDAVAHGGVIPPLEPVPMATDGTGVTVQVAVPASAEVWFDGEKTAQTGPSRMFRSPSLRPGVAYLYLVRAKWNENGREMEQIQSITVHAGENISVAFPVARP
jgi:uncharacterized protein (TIGR03000 family)